MRRKNIKHGETQLIKTPKGIKLVPVSIGWPSSVDRRKSQVWQKAAKSPRDSTRVDSTVLVSTRVHFRNINLVRRVKFRIVATHLKRWYNKLEHQHGSAHVVEWLHPFFLTLWPGFEPRGNIQILTRGQGVQGATCANCLNSQTTILSKPTYVQFFLCILLGENSYLV